MHRHNIFLTGIVFTAYLMLYNNTSLADTQNNDSNYIVSTHNARDTRKTIERSDYMHELLNIDKNVQQSSTLSNLDKPMNLFMHFKTSLPFLNIIPLDFNQPNITAAGANSGIQGKTSKFGTIDIDSNKNVITDIIKNHLPNIQSTSNDISGNELPLSPFNLLTNTSDIWSNLDKTFDPQ